MKVNRRRNITLTVRLTEEEKAHIVNMAKKANLVRRILTNPFYCGDLVNHQRERSRITKKQIKVPKEEQFIHRDAVPAIIPRGFGTRYRRLYGLIQRAK